MKKIDLFTNMYSVSKTLKFSLIPIGKTEENFNKMNFLEEDEIRSESYKKVKNYMDNYHREYIDAVLSNFHFKSNDKLHEYSDLFFSSDKSKEKTKQMESIESELRKQITDALVKNNTYKKLWGKEFIREILPKTLSNQEEIDTVNQFSDFSTYFRGFWDNRENMYSSEKKSTSISYRCINDNLPKFLNNIKAFAKIKEVLSNEISELTSNLYEIHGFETSDLFSTDFFEFVLSKNGIEKYNSYIGGYSNSDGQKIKGLNEYINLYNQKLSRSEKNLRLPKMVPLYKQILSDKSSISFIPEKFGSDNELLTSVRDFHELQSKNISEIQKLFSELDEYDIKGIYVSSGAAVTDISSAAFGSWNIIPDAWNSEYRTNNPIKKQSAEKYEKSMKSAYKSIESFSLYELQKYGGEDIIVTFFKNRFEELISSVKNCYTAAQSLICTEYPENKTLITDEASIEKIKKLLDSYKALEKSMKILCGNSKEPDRDMSFYGTFMPLYDELCLIDKLYNKSRNYLTRKPYSKDKIKLNFQNPQFLAGWDKNKERDYRTVLLKKQNNYYLAIMNKSESKVFSDDIISEYTAPPCYSKINYKLLPGPNKMLPKVFFAKSNIDYYAPDSEILKIRENETFKKGPDFSLNDCHKLIDFFKASISKHPEWKNFGFTFSPTESYEDISQFYREVSNQGYSITYSDISESYIDFLVSEGKIFLFQIYNKDFSPFSHGTPNMHTLYFKEIFEPENLQDVVYKLDGQAEMFYRKASLEAKARPTHPANIPIANKNPDNPKKESIFEYDLIKDKRFTKRQFSIHLPVTLNYKANGRDVINSLVRKSVRESKCNNIIGIDRGERNLIYICVIDENEKIICQRSLNEIINNDHHVNYSTLLDAKGKSRDRERKDWKTIENIKELKEGYLSAVVNEICKLVVEYDALIVMEDLNRGFKNTRIKVDKQVYQKFENMLISKLNFLADKKKKHTEPGGLLKSYQLTNKGTKLDNSVQNGFIFYIPAYLTSKIDPETGFADILHPRYKSVEASQTFFSKFDQIEYSTEEKMFLFTVDMTKFEKGSLSYKKIWTIYSNDERIISFRNPEKNNEYDNKIVNLTQEFISLMKKYDIKYTENLKEQILKRTEKDFFEGLTRLFALTLQMRNSITNDPNVDYIISPVKNKNGEFYDSRKHNSEHSCLPADADANGAYNIARKGLWAIQQIKNADENEYEKISISIKNSEWLEYVQKKS